MIIDKTLKAAAHFTAESNIRPTLRGVLIKDGRLYATDSFRACSFKFNLKGRPDLDHSEYPEIGLKDLDLSEPICLDGSFLKKLKFKKSKIGVLDQTMLMGELQENMVHFGKTDLDTVDLVATRKIYSHAEEKIAPKYPDIEGFIKDAKAITEVSLQIDLLIDTLKAFKEKGAMAVNIGIGSLGGSENHGRSEISSQTPVLIGDSDRSEDVAILMPQKRDTIFGKHR